MFKLVKVNFFQKSFEPWHRNFFFAWHQGNYLRYLKNRIQWYLYPNLKRVSEFPLHLDIETAATCNMRCPMCANRHISKEKFRNYGRMDVALLKKIVDEAAANHCFSVRLSWRGEVFTHPDFLQMVHYAKITKKIPQVSFLTNGMKLEGNVAKALIEYGVDYISVSIDGMDEMYEAIRKPMTFDLIYEKLKTFKAMKEQMRRKKPLVRVTTLWPAIASNPRAYYDKMSSVCDKIVYNPLKDYKIKTQDRPGFDICQFLYERMFIGWDGAVHPCSNTTNEFIIGNIKETTIKNLWKGPELNRIREMHEQGNRLRIHPCDECSYGVDYEKHWRNRDWKNWDPKELLPHTEIKPESIKGSADG